CIGAALEPIVNAPCSSTTYRSPAGLIHMSIASGHELGAPPDEIEAEQLLKDALPRLSGLGQIQGITCKPDQDEVREAGVHDPVGTGGDVDHMDSSAD